MAVDLSAPAPDAILPVRGVTLGVAQANIRKPDRKDLLVIALAPGSYIVVIQREYEPEGARYVAD